MAPQVRQDGSETTPLLSQQQQRNRALGQSVISLIATVAVMLGVTVVVIVSVQNVDFGKELDKEIEDTRQEPVEEEGYQHVWDINKPNTPVRFTIEVTEDRLQNGLNDTEISLAAAVEAENRGVPVGDLKVEDVYYELRFHMAIRGAGDCSASAVIGRAMKAFVGFAGSGVEVGECSRLTIDDTYDDKEFDAVVTIPRSSLKKQKRKPGEYIFELIDRVTPLVFTNELHKQGAPAIAKCFRVRHGITSAYAVANLKEEEAGRRVNMDAIDLEGGNDTEEEVAEGPAAGPAPGPAGAKLGNPAKGWMMEHEPDYETPLSAEAVGGEGAPRFA